jgi:pimeloyl-ACP methyl ester carboxylesterase
MRRSPHQFTGIGSMSPVLWVARNYAVLDGPTFPVVAEGEEEPNDTFVEQLRGAAGAAVKELVDRGVTDPGRVSVGGHSYGAFMAANLLAHCPDLFAAGGRVPAGGVGQLWGSGWHVRVDPCGPCLLGRHRPGLVILSRACVYSDRGHAAHALTTVSCCMQASVVARPLLAVDSLAASRSFVLLLPCDRLLYWLLPPLCCHRHCPQRGL